MASMALLHGIMQVRGPKGQVTRLRDVDGSETKLFGSFRSRSPGLTVADHMTAQRLLCHASAATANQHVLLTTVTVLTY